MLFTQESVFPETQPLILHARSLSNRPWEQRYTPFQSVGHLLQTRVNERPSASWLLFYDESGSVASYTFGEFFDLASRAASLLQDQVGVEQGNRIATLMANDPRTVLLYFAAWLLGATIVPLNIGSEDEQIGFILANAKVRALFAFDDQVTRAKQIVQQFNPPPQIVPTGSSNGRMGIPYFEQLLYGLNPLGSFPPTDPDTEALIVYTSGTTGPPKGVVLDHANLLADACSIAEWNRFGPEDRAINVLPIHHVNGTVVTLLTPLYSGGSVVLNRRFYAQTYWQTIERERCTWSSVVPTVLAFLCERHEDTSQYNLSHFRHILCGAGPLTTELARRFEEQFHIPIIHGYGLSETTCYSCFLPIDLDEKTRLHWLTECGFPSIGCPLPVNEMDIHDAEGRSLPAGERGEIVIRGHNVMRCYYARPEANRDTFAHGWFRSGDEGFYLNGEDGRPYFFITGRIKELIIRGGVNYSPFDIDEVLNAIPGVRAAMAVGFENDYYGEEVGAYVQLEEGSSLTEEEILAACRKRLPFEKSPKVVVFGTSFPVTSTGKYQRNKLKPLFAAWKSVQFREKTKET